MIKFDFSTYINNFLDKNIYNDLLQKKESIKEKFMSDKMSSWYDYIPDQKTLEEMKKISFQIKNNSDVLLVIGIGGSYMGSYSMQQLFVNKYQKNKPEVIYIGHDLSSSNLNEVMEYIKDKNISVNVISRSGKTYEIKIVYNIIKEYMMTKYSSEELKKRIIVTTSSNSSYLKEEAEKYGFTTFNIPDGIGGRYSIATPAHLLPMLIMNIDIENFLKGYSSGKQYLDQAYQYASIRNTMFKSKKYVENYSIYESKLYYYTEFLKQLFAESEGKDNKGLIPISTVNTRDLHSLGQLLQEGNKIVFETIIKSKSNSNLIYNNKTLNEYNDILCNSVINAHYNGNVPNIIIDIDKITEETMGELTMFFLLSAAFSAYLFDVYPFDQPGVEAYKSIVKENL